MVCCAQVTQQQLCHGVSATAYAPESALHRRVVERPKLRRTEATAKHIGKYAGFALLLSQLEQVSTPSLKTLPGPVQACPRRGGYTVSYGKTPPVLKAERCG